jgi:glycosyltransferase involved in cell wall biosynthesis
MLLPGLDHFVADLLDRLPMLELELRAFYVHDKSDLIRALAWADDPLQDIIWFEFCWPPFPAMIQQTDFGGRRVVMRVHRIEAYGTKHAATAPWAKIDDVIVVSADMAMRLKSEAPNIEDNSKVHIIYNGVDTQRFSQSHSANPYRIGWCGWLSLHKNPIMALEILHILRQEDSRCHLHLCSKGGEHVALDSFNHLKRRLGLQDAVVIDGNVPHDDMPAWHAANRLLLSTSVYESFGYAMAEAASCGCDIAMLDQAGAAEFWPLEMRFGTAAEAAALARTSRPGRWRELVVNQFSLERQIETLRNLLSAIVLEDQPLRVGPADDLLDLSRSTSPVIDLDARPDGEIEAAEFLLKQLGYRMAGKSKTGCLYVAER